MSGPYGPPQGQPGQWSQPQGQPGQWGQPQWQGQPGPTGQPYGGVGPAYPPPKRGRSGCIWGCLVVLLVLAVLGVVGVFVGMRALEAGINKLVGGECDLVTKADVDAALGGEHDVFGVGTIAQPVLDTRVLAEAPTCWASETNPSSDMGTVVRIARQESADAHRVFQEERRVAKGVTEDRGGGITVSSEPYFHKDVDHGDEAFCTTGLSVGIASGALVRKGDVLVYVSFLDPSVGGNDDENCARALTLVDRVE